MYEYMTDSGKPVTPFLPPQTGLASGGNTSPSLFAYRISVFFFAFLTSRITCRAIRAMMGFYRTDDNVQMFALPNNERATIRRTTNVR